MSGPSPSPPDSSLDEATEEGFILVSAKGLLSCDGLSLEDAMLIVKGLSNCLGVFASSIGAICC